MPAPVAKLVDAPDLGSGVERRVGSSPIRRTIIQKRNSQKKRVPLFFENRQCEQQKVTRSAAPVVPRGLRKASVVNFNENRQCQQRLVKRRTGEARSVWAAIRRRCQFYYQNRQCEQQKVTRSAAPVVPRGLRKASVVNFNENWHFPIGVEQLF